MKRIVVTGANKGIGLAICKKLLSDRSDTYVLMGSRDFQKGQIGIETILSELGGDLAYYQSRIEVLQVDVDDAESVSAAALSVATKFGLMPPPIFGLINNAGIGFDFLGGTRCKNG